VKECSNPMTTWPLYARPHMLSLSLEMCERRSHLPSSFSPLLRYLTVIQISRQLLYGY